MTSRLLLLTFVAFAMLSFEVAHAQSDEMKKASRLYSQAGGIYGDAEDDAAAGRDDKAQQGFSSALQKLREARGLLNGEMYRFRYAEALSLRGLGRIDEAWLMLQELSAQTDAPEIAELARNDAAALVETFGRARIDFDCGAQSTEVRIGGPTGDAGATGSLHQWVACNTLRKGWLVAPGPYVVSLRRADDKGSVVTRTLDLTPGERRTIAVHYALAPPSDVCFQVSGGCASTVQKMKCP